MPECHTNLPEYVNKLKTDTDQDFVSFTALSKDQMSHVCHGYQPCQSWLMQLTCVTDRWPPTTNWRPNKPNTSQLRSSQCSNVFSTSRCLLGVLSGNHTFSHCSSFHSSCQLTTTRRSVINVLIRCHVISSFVLTLRSKYTWYVDKMGFKFLIFRHFLIQIVDIRF